MPFIEELSRQEWHKQHGDEDLLEFLVDKIAYVSPGFLEECVKVGDIANPLKYFLCTPKLLALGNLTLIVFLVGNRSVAVDFAKLQNFPELSVRLHSCAHRM